MAKIEVKDIKFGGAELFTDSEDFMDALQEDSTNGLYGAGASPWDLNTDPIFIPCPCPHPTRPVLYPLPCLPLVL